MSGSTKALLIVIAITAFAIGVAVNTVSVSDQVDTGPLLSAKLMQPGETLSLPPGSVSVGELIGELTLVNFWASWCAPCRKEMPIFENMYRQARAEPGKRQGFQIIGIAIDSPDKTQAMLDSMGITYPIVYAEQTGMQLMEHIGNTQGFLPYSLLLDKDGNVLEKILGRIHEQDIVSWLDKYL